MSKDIYNPPSSELSEEKLKNKKVSNSLIAKSWRGEIQLWKAIVFVSVLGFIAALALGIFGANMIYTTTNNLFLGVIYQFIITMSYGVFCIVTVWRASPNPKVSMKGILAKLWALVIAAFLLFSLSRFLGL